MPSHARISWFVVVVGFLASGCTSEQLCRNTVSQMETVHELQQQQVLDNLAMFVCNRDSYPYYTLVTSGNTQLTDSGTMAVTNSFGRVGLAFLYTGLGINPSVQRQAQDVWQLNPINDSVKLTLMRCAYQRAVAGCFGESTDCPNCRSLFCGFYGAFVPPPTVTSITPDSGGANGGESVTITGTNLNCTQEVYFGRAAVTSFDSVTPNWIVLRTPKMNIADLIPRPKNKENSGDQSGEPAQHQKENIPPPSPEPAQEKTTHPNPVDVYVVTPSGESNHCEFNYQTTEYAKGERTMTAAPAAGPQAPHIPGIVTPECLLKFKPGWFCSGQKHHVPKGNSCKFVGHYCDTYVWVPPSGVNELTQLTILIQDLAFYDFPAGATPSGSRTPSKEAYPNLLPDAATIKAFTPQPLLPLPQ